MRVSLLTSARKRGLRRISYACPRRMKTASSFGPRCRVGSSVSQESVALLLTRLSVIPEFSDVRLESSNRNEQGGGYQFVIAATIAPEGEVQQ